MWVKKDYLKWAIGDNDNHTLEFEDTPLKVCDNKEESGNPTLENEGILENEDAPTLKFEDHKRKGKKEIRPPTLKSRRSLMSF